MQQQLLENRVGPLAHLSRGRQRQSLQRIILLLELLQLLSKISAKQPDTSLTADSAMDYLTNAPSNQSFADFQAAQSAQAAQDAQAALDAQTAQDLLTAQTVQAELECPGCK